MKPYTVILRYPDYSFADVYVAHVAADDANGAIAEARRAIAEARGAAIASNTAEDGECFIKDGGDFAAIAVYDGHLEQAPWG